MNGRTALALAAAALGIVACVDVPDNMRAQFAPAGPNDRTNYRPGAHGTAMPAPYEPILPLPDAGAPADAGAPPIPNAPSTSPVEDAAAPVAPMDGGVA